MQYVLRLLNRDPAWMAVLVSLFLSVIIILTDDIINSDGILYIEVAGMIFHGDWASAIAQYNWPFYPLLIAGLSKITFLNLEAAAHVLNASLLALLAYVFVRCAQALGGNQRVAIFAGILLLTNVVLNGYRDLIIRDFGYWAFFFTTLLFFLKYSRTFQAKYIIGITVSIVVATLFRIEGVVFAVAAPFILLFHSGTWKQRLSRCGLLLSPIIVMAIVVIIYLDQATSFETGRILDPLIYLQNFMNNISHGIENKGRLLVKHVLGLSNRSMGTESMLAILFMFLIVKTIKASGSITFLFSVWASFSGHVRHRIADFNIISGFMFINLLVLTMFLMSQNYLSPRYAMSLALLVTLSAAFGLEAFFRGESPKILHLGKIWQRRLQILMVIVLVYMFLDGLTSFSARKGYLRDSANWVKENIASDAQLYSNQEILYYYSGRLVPRKVLTQAIADTYYGKLPKMKQMQRKGYDYVAIKIGRKQIGFEKKVINWAGSQPIYRAANKRGDAILIFKLQK